MNQENQFSRRKFLSKTTTAAAGWTAVCLCGRFCPTADAAAPGKFQYDGCCGDYCGACPVMLESEKATKPSEIKCYGCKPLKPNGQPSGCDKRKCALSKGLKNCSACKEYPCAKLKAYHHSYKDKPGYTLLAAFNLERIKAVGGGGFSF